MRCGHPSHAGDVHCNNLFGMKPLKCSDGSCCRLVSGCSICNSALWAPYFVCFMFMSPSVGCCLTLLGSSAAQQHKIAA